MSPSRPGGLGKMPRIPGLGGNAASPAMGIPTPPPPSAAPARPNLNFRRATIAPRGPRWFSTGHTQQRAGGPGEPPPGFVGPTTSAVEWILYWASSRLFGPPDPRQPPYVGNGVEWGYQEPFNPGNPRELGGSVSDFVYYLGTGIVIVRLDTWFYHITANPTQVAKDRNTRLEAYRFGSEVRTIYDTAFVGDASGAAAVRILADTLSGREQVNPVTSGLAYEVRNRVTGLVP